jgi:hypothetical protein
METTLVAGSISSITQVSGKSLALAFMDVETVVLIDTSGSMGAMDSRGGQSRYNIACEELSKLQGNNPGKILVISFSDEVQVCLNGIPYNFMGGTIVGRALQYAKQYDLPGMNIILISDGEPMDESNALHVAKTYQNPISTIYVGPPDELRGREFLEKLAAATGGKTVTADRAKELASSITTLLLKG